jgi:hypothetical protein
MTTEFWVQMVVYGISVGSFAGVVLTRLSNIEKKMDKHNQLMERVAALEKDVESVHYRIQEIREEFK